MSVIYEKRQIHFKKMVCDLARSKIIIKVFS